MLELTMKTSNCVDCQKKLSDYRNKRCLECHSKSKQKRIDLKCQQCGRNYWTFPSRTTIQRNSKYCSIRCSSLSKNTKVDRVCKTCGTKFTISPSQLNYYKGAGKYCSKQCSYKGIAKEAEKKPIKDKYGRSKRKADNTWKSAVREKYNYTCARCGKYDKYAHTHHVKPRSRFPELKHDVSNGICVCNSCHTWIHGNPKEATRLGLFYVWRWANE